MNSATTTRGGTTGDTTRGTATGTRSAPGAARAAAWPQGPHAAAMISFNQLPSRWLHASRWAGLLPPGWAAPADGEAARHRHCSALILRQLGAAAAPVTDWSRPEWPLALLPAAAWSRLLLRLGLVTLQRPLRQAIRGDELRALAAAIGDAELDWVRRTAPALAPELDGAAEPPPPAQLPQRLPQLGAALLAQAGAAAPLPMRLRLALRAPAAAAARPDVGATRAAWALALRLLDELEPAWRSSFPSSR